MVDGGAQEVSKSPLRALHLRGVFLFEECREKALRDILGVIDGKALATKVGVDGAPIDADDLVIVLAFDHGPSSGEEGVMFSPHRGLGRGH
jgi:hypothetical protein